MTKQEFLDALRLRLAGLPQEDIEERLGFYSEMIEDRIEDGLPEAEAVAGIGGIDEIMSQILADFPLAKIVKEKVKPKRSLRAWEIVLLIVGSPIWLSLLIAAFAVFLSLYIVLWSLVITLWAVDLSLMISSLGGIVASAALFAQGNTSVALALLGAGLMLAGCSIFLFFGCLAASKGVVILTKKIFMGIKTMLIGKEQEK